MKPILAPIDTLFHLLALFMSLVKDNNVFIRILKSVRFRERSRMIAKPYVRGKCGSGADAAFVIGEFSRADPKAS